MPPGLSTSASGAQTLWQYSQAGQLLFAWKGPTAQTTHEYVYLAGSLVATIDHAWPSNAITATKYQHTDALGSPIAMSNEAGTVIERTNYDPYGGPIGKVVDGIGYTGHVMDGLTGLTNMQQRYYDQGVGRFLSVDPVSASSINGGNFNRYWYANNNPYKFVDPDGRESDSPRKRDRRSICDGQPRRCENRPVSTSTTAGSSATATPNGTSNGSSSERTLATIDNHGNDGIDGTETLQRTWVISPASDRGGWVIQRVTSQVSVTTKQGSTISETYTFFEAWKIGAGDSMALPYSADMFKMYSVNASLYSSVTVNISASASFYEGFVLPSSFAQGRVPAANDLWSSWVAPTVNASQGTAPVNVQFRIDWP